MMELDQERKLTCCGDEPYNEENEKYALKSDYLLHEAFCLYDQADIFHPYEKHHSTVKDACQLAEKLKVNYITAKIKILKIVKNFIQKKEKLILVGRFMFLMIYKQ